MNKKVVKENHEVGEPKEVLMMDGVEVIVPERPPRDCARIMDDELQWEVSELLVYLVDDCFYGLLSYIQPFEPGFGESELFWLFLAVFSFSFNDETIGVVLMVFLAKIWESWTTEPRFCIAEAKNNSI